MRARIVVADDNPPFLQFLVSLLAADFDVVATASDGKSALELIHQHKPDIVVLDLQMPRLNGIEVTKHLAAHPPSPAVVICSVETDPAVVDAALRAGALAYVFKSRVEKDLVPAVKSVVQGKPFPSAGIW
jgi:two-component system response regulator DegU